MKISIMAHGSRLTAHGSRLTAHGSRLTAHGSRLTAHGSRLTAHGSPLRSNFPQFLRHTALILLLCLASFSPAQAADITLSSAVLINSSNKDTYNGKSIGGTIPSGSSAGAFGDFISKGAVVVDGIELSLTIDGLNVNYSGMSSMLSGISLVNGATLHLTVSGTNTLKAGYGGAGIAVPDGTTLEITAQSSGTLNVTGGKNYGGGAGIGSIGNRHATAAYGGGTDDLIIPQGLGDIIINGGTINAQGGTWYHNVTVAGGAAGIGSSEYSGATTSPTFKDNRYLNNITGSVTINGGTVNATGGYCAAGIGGGSNGTLKTISITGGTVTATGGDGGAAIGLGTNVLGDGTLTCPAISITAGTVTANGNIGYGMMTIDWFGNQNVGGSVTIDSNATVKCTGTIAPYEAASIPSNSYVDANGNLQQAQNPTSAFGADTWNTGWHVVDQYTEITPRIIVNGTVNLILNDGATLKANGGIHVYKGNTLNIYAQVNGTGKIVARGGGENAGIGGGYVSKRTSNGQWDKSCGTINIYGGTVEATGSTYAAGIGCGAIYQDTTDGGTVNIHGGTVTATGGQKGAGIGGGRVIDAEKFTSYPAVNISGGTVNAKGGQGGAGIGGGDKCPGGTITITGGNVTATTQDSRTGSGIGNGYKAYNATIKLGWKKFTDSIYAQKYDGGITITSDFMLKGTSTQATTGNIGGQTIVPTVTIRYETNDGSGNVEEEKTAYGNPYELPDSAFKPSPKRGKGFDCLLIGDVEYSEGGSFDATSDVVVKTVWKETDRLVSFDMNGHGEALASQTVEYGKTMDEPDAPTAEGLTFGGWYKEADCVNRWNFAADTVTEDMTLYAKWAVNAYTITYNLDGGIDATNNPLVYTVNDAAITLEVPTKTGYTFKGWTPDGTIPSGSTGNKTFTATWEINKYTITFETWGGTEIASITQDYSTDVTPPATTPTKRGAVFSEWENLPSKMPAENITVNAVWRTLYHYEAREATCFEEGISDCWYLYGNYYTETLSDGVYSYTLMTDSPVTEKGKHSYPEPASSSWTWFTDSYSGEMAARLTLACPICHTSVSVNTSEGEVTSEVTTEPTDSTEGVMTYTATVTVEAATYNTEHDATYTNTHTETIPKTTKIARVGGNWYSSLKAALDEASDGDVIMLSVDVYEPDAECGDYSKSITIDLNGHDVTLKSIALQGSLTVKNGTLKCKINNDNTGSANTLTLDNAELICEGEFIENEDDEGGVWDMGIQWLAKNIAVTNYSTLSITGGTYLGGGADDGFNLTLDETSSIELSDATLSGYNESLVWSEFRKYLPEGYSISDSQYEGGAGKILYNGEEYVGTVELGTGDGYTPYYGPYPAFAYNSLMLEGQIGVNFYMYLPEIEGLDYTKGNQCWMSFTISGKGSVSNEDQVRHDNFTYSDDTNTYYGFRCYINSLQMADTITATLHYVIDGVERTVSQQISAQEYLDGVMAEVSGTDKQLMIAIKDYGHYAQIMLENTHKDDENEDNRFIIGTDYAEMPLGSEHDYTAAEIYETSQDVQQYVFNNGNETDSGIEAITYSLNLDSSTGVNIYLKLSESYSGNLEAYLNGGDVNIADEVTGKRQYKVKLSDIPAHELGKNCKLSIKAEKNFELEFSPMSYVRTVLNDVSDDAECKAMAALYKYYESTMAYRKAHGYKD